MRSTFGWDLPPGVTTSMLPGNSAAEQEAEARWDAVAAALDQAGVKDEGVVEKALDLLMPMIDRRYSDGYNAASSDEAMYRSMAESIYLRKVDADTDSECWVICAKGDNGAERFIQAPVI